MAHVADSGRLVEIFDPGARMLLEPPLQGEDARKTAYRLALADAAQSGVEALCYRCAVRPREVLVLPGLLPVFLPPGRKS